MSFPDFQQNGSSKQFSNGELSRLNPRNYNNKLSPLLDYVHNVLQEDVEEEQQHQQPNQKMSPNGDDWDDGLTFTAKSSRKYSFIQIRCCDGSHLCFSSRIICVGGKNL